MQGFFAMQVFFPMRVFSPHETFPHMSFPSMQAYPHFFSTRGFFPHMSLPTCESVPMQIFPSEVSTHTFPLCIFTTQAFPMQISPHLSDFPYVSFSMWVFSHVSVFPRCQKTRLYVKINVPQIKLYTTSVQIVDPPDLAQSCLFYVAN